MFTERTSVGLDVHARSVAAAAIDGVTGEVFKARLVPAPEVVIRWVESLPGPSAAVYESGPTGFGLARALTAAGIRCEVAAASKLQRPAGDRVKTDARDALHLARLCAWMRWWRCGCRPRWRSRPGTWCGAGRRPGRT